MMVLNFDVYEITKQVYIHDTEEKKNAMNTLMNGFFKEMDSK